MATKKTPIDTLNKMLGDVFAPKAKTVPSRTATVKKMLADKPAKPVEAKPAKTPAKAAKTPSAASEPTTPKSPRKTTVKTPEDAILDAVKEGKPVDLTAKFRAEAEAAGRSMPVSKPPVATVKKTLKKASKTPAAEATPAPAAPAPVKEPVAYVDANRHAYLYVGPAATGDAKGFLTFRTGGVTVEFLRTDFLTPVETAPIKQAVAHYATSQLPKSDLARLVIDAIQGGKDPSQRDFLTPIYAEKKQFNIAPNLWNPAPAKGDKPAKQPRAAKAPKPEGDFVPLKVIVEELKLDARLVRIQLRANMTKPAQGWAWPKAEVAKVKATIAGYFKG